MISLSYTNVNNSSANYDFYIHKINNLLYICPRRLDKTYWTYINAGPEESVIGYVVIKDFAQYCYLLFPQRI